MKAEFNNYFLIHSFSGRAYSQTPLVWSTFGTPAFISAQTSSKFHATPLTDLPEFAMNNRYLGNLDWVLIWHYWFTGAKLSTFPLRGQKKWLFVEGTKI